MPRTQPGSNVPTTSQYDGRDERHPLALALDHEARRDRLHATGGEARHDLLPEDGRDLVAVEAIEDPARLLRVDEPLVDRRASPRARARIASFVISWKTMRRTGTPFFGFSTCEQVPGDRLALAILVRREQELVGVRELLPQVG